MNTDTNFVGILFIWRWTLESVWSRYTAFVVVCCHCAIAKRHYDEIYCHCHLLLSADMSAHKLCHFFLPLTKFGAVWIGKFVLHSVDNVCRNVGQLDQSGSHGDCWVIELVISVFIVNVIFTWKQWSLDFPNSMFFVSLSVSSISNLHIVFACKLYVVNILTFIWSVYLFSAVTVFTF